MEQLAAPAKSITRLMVFFVHTVVIALLSEEALRENILFVFYVVVASSTARRFMKSR